MFKNNRLGQELNIGLESHIKMTEENKKQVERELRKKKSVGEAKITNSEPMPIEIPKPIMEIDGMELKTLKDLFWGENKNSILHSWKELGCLQWITHFFNITSEDLQ